MLDDRIRYSVLLDLYGSLLSERQYEAVNYSVNEDLSLSEISEITGITRQGVRDAMKKAEEELERYESCLGLYEKKIRNRSAAAEILNGLSGKIGIDENNRIKTLLERICE
ncbi:MAG: DNA-binding protein [Clostridia bacterium]|nr:DNA-binding protein [Clostridia bacterium]